VPPAQSEVIVQALEQRGVPHAYIAFAGEGHGFRKSANVKRALEAHVSFLAQIFGFEPADDLEPIEIENLDKAVY
jgi:dipeptidyl aminopeptidase/acylaminoacyl peptidase